MEMTPCLECLDGHVWQECPICEGAGWNPNNVTQPCAECKGNGEVDRGICSTCNGAKEISLALSYIIWASRQTGERHFRADSNSDQGITRISLAKYHYFRDGGPFTKVIGYAYGLHDEDAIVILTNEKGEALKFHGFQWGYGGEGPTGLCYMLADAGFFTSIAEARSFVSKQRSGTRWSIG